MLQENTVSLPLLASLHTLHTDRACSALLTCWQGRLVDVPLKMASNSNSTLVKLLADHLEPILTAAAGGSLNSYSSCYRPISDAIVQQVSEACSCRRSTDGASAPCKLACVHVVLQLLPSLLPANKQYTLSLWHDVKINCYLVHKANIAPCHSKCH